ncbi:MAG TPA: glycoside hydrolase family 3 C-terminal domain-containing protein [Candidatus Limnocylindrales bacterium]|nr:glycoside hydrolase family 3 C-terminal domain-containing protein [Candidatus Limnocylindrales bacterium]
MSDARQPTDRDLPGWDRDQEALARARAIRDRMTLEEKVEFVTGDRGDWNYAFYNGPIDHLGIPALTMADGPAGVRINNQSVHDGRSTALPAPIALAATWDPEQAAHYGDVIGAEAFASGHNVQLAPAVDIARAPLGGRTFEAFGEDPLLQSRMVVPEILAIQRHPVHATIKHVVANNQEYQRFTVDARVDERTLREIYLPPFEAAVRDAHVAAAMGAFNKVNGIFSCENRAILVDILKDEWGFRGWVMSDYDATWSTTAAANGGLDNEQPTGRFWGPRLLAAIHAGEVEVAQLDDMVERILFPMAALGLLDRPVDIAPLPVEANGLVARGIAERSMVLLQNDGILPLAADGVRSIAVIGPDADNTSAAGAGSGMLKAAYGVSALDGIRQRAGDGVRVEYEAGVDPVSAAVLLPGLPAVPSDFLRPADDGNGEGRGLTGTYWPNLRFADMPVLQRVDPEVALNLGFYNIPLFNGISPKLALTPGSLNGRMSARWTGSLVVPLTGRYELSLTSFGAGRLFVDGELVIDIPGGGADDVPDAGATDNPPIPPMVPGVGPVERTTALDLLADRPATLRLEYAADSPELSPQAGPQFRLGWRPPDGLVQPGIAAAAELAARSDVAIVVARDYETEMMDRPDLLLPNNQDALIRAVAAANPRTVVVLMNGAPIETAAWDQDVAALVEAWFAGQEQGHALASVLFGDVDASGRLPLTFPRSLAETPVSSAAQYPGVDGVATYSEGVMVGYRGYDELGLQPRFPFGHGLSYTTFEYGGLEVDPAPAAEDDVVATVSFEVANTGSRPGVEVAQVYVGRLPGPTRTPLRQLAGWARIGLDPGERRRVSVAIARRSVSVWDVDTHAWQTPAGDVSVEVGRSSRDLRLSARVGVR